MCLASDVGSYQCSDLTLVTAHDNVRGIYFCPNKVYFFRL